MVRSMTPIISFIKVPSCTSQGCSQVGKAITLPATAVVVGLILILSFTMSHSVEVAGTDWVEPVLVWMAIMHAHWNGKVILVQSLAQTNRRC